MRDLQAVHDADPDRQLWAKAMADTLLEANTAGGAACVAGLSSLDPATLATVLNHYRGAAALGVSDKISRRGRLSVEALTLARRFTRHQAMILRFATDLTAPFTNNQAERDARPVKVQQRTSGGCWRTLEGLGDFAIVQSYLSTAHKWGHDSLAVLRQLFTTGRLATTKRRPHLNSYPLPTEPGLVDNRTGASIPLLSSVRSSRVKPSTSAGAGGVPTPSESIGDTPNVRRRSTAPV